MRNFSYISVQTVDEALAQLSKTGAGDARPLAGGTDLLTLMKAAIVAPAQLVNSKQLDDLPSGVAETGGRGTIGALTTLSAIARDPLIQQGYPLLAEAISLTATPQLRNMATIGGNLLQRPRCWYFRNAQVSCWLKGGEDCPARDGENQLHALFDVSPCVAVNPSDLAATLVALDALVRLRGPDGERTLALAELFASPTDERRRETTLGDDVLILSLELPPIQGNTRSTYLKAMDRKVWAFALVGVATMLRLGGPSGRRIEEARLVLSGVAPTPLAGQPAEQLLIGAEADPALFAQAAEVALAKAQPLKHNGYKLALARALMCRALASLATP